MKKHILTRTWSDVARTRSAAASSETDHGSAAVCHRPLLAAAQRLGLARETTYGRPRRRSKSRDWRSPCQDFWIGVPAIQKKCAAIASVPDEPAQPVSSSLVRGCLAMNFMNVDFPDPGLPEIQNVPLP